MPAFNRTAIYSALFELLKTVPGFASHSRQYVDSDRVPQNQQPALVSAGGDQAPTGQARDQATTWRLGALYLIYARADPDPNVDVLDGLIDAVEAVLSRPDGGGEWQPDLEGTTLGGLVSHCKMVGAVKTFDGAATDQLVAIIEIEMQVLKTP